MSQPHNIWAVVPAAGVGKRMQSSVPKQYLKLNGVPVLQHSLQRLLDIPAVSALVVAIGTEDSHWHSVKLKSEKLMLVTEGGAERYESVLNALESLQQQAAFNAEQDWVLVHDAVRPCVRSADIERLLAEAGQHPDGGLLAIRVRDTIKRENSDTSVAETVQREGLWQAQTPQLFPWRLLVPALRAARSMPELLTDESSAMEAAGYAPKLVAGSADNIKITQPEDIQMAEHFLNAQRDSR